MKLQELTADYAERVYAGVLGKTIGVYLGRPFEQWSHRAIMDRLGEIEGYVHDQLGVPLVVADDDLSGTFTFLRALEDAGYPDELKPEEVGEAWLNYLIEQRTVLWWGGMGHSAEHTAYLRLKHGLKPPESGSIVQNGPIVAQQIGAQIFIDGWGMVCPGDPRSAADLAKRAAVVAHDGEAVIAAQVVAAMVAAAFTAPDIETALDLGLAQAPKNSLIAQLANEIRATQKEGLDWHDAFRRMEEKYNYELFGGGCHVIPNHAVIILALAHGGSDFDLSLRIVNTCGYDTDCNSGNVGCILGILNGLPGIDARWRDPVADRLLLPTADGGRCITDCVREAQAVTSIARKLRGLDSQPSPRFSFPFPCSVQGFTSEEAQLSNQGDRLRIEATGPATATSPTFFLPDQFKASGYGLMASPTLYPGQTLRARVAAVGSPVRVSLLLRVYGADDALFDRFGPVQFLTPGPAKTLEWQVPDLEGRPIAAVGFRLEGAGTLEVDELDWTGEPETSLGPTPGGTIWRKAWVNGLSELNFWGPGMRAIQNEGTGLALHGTQEWQDVVFTCRIVPTMAASFGLAVRAQGMRRYVAALVEDGKLRLVRVTDGKRKILAENPIDWPLGQSAELSVAARGNRFYAKCGETRVQAEDDRLPHGAVAIVVTEGRIDCDAIQVRPAAQAEAQSTLP